MPRHRSNRSILLLIIPVAYTSFLIAYVLKCPLEAKRDRNSGGSKNQNNPACGHAGPNGIVARIGSLEKSSRGSGLRGLLICRGFLLVLVFGGGLFLLLFLLSRFGI